MAYHAIDHNVQKVEVGQFPKISKVKR